MAEHDFTTNTVNTSDDGYDAASSTIINIAAGIQVAGYGTNKSSEKSAGLHVINDASIFNLGEVIGSGAGIRIAGEETTINNLAGASIIGETAAGVQGDGGLNVIFNSGTISGTSCGIHIALPVSTSQLDDGQNQIQNAGTIEGLVGDGVNVSGIDNTLTNSGTILATGGSGVTFSTAFAGEDVGFGSIANSGLIRSSDGFGVAMTGNQNQLENSGTIGGKAGVGAISFAGTGNTIDNDGRVNGEIFLNGSANNVDELTNTGVISAPVNAIAETGGNTLNLANAGKILGAIQFDGIETEQDTLTNAVGATIQSSFDITINGGQALLSVQNAGTITGGIAFNSDSIDGAGTLDNSGTINSSGTAVETDINSSVVITNSGTITGMIFLEGSSFAGDTIFNSGIIEKATDAAGGSAIAELAESSLNLVNSGTILGSVRFGHSATGNIYDGTLGSISGTVFGAGGSDTMLGGAGRDHFNFSSASGGPAAGGSDTAEGGAGNDTFVFSTLTLTKRDTIDGGAGNDTLTFSDNGIITAASLANVSSIEIVNLSSAGANLITLTNDLINSTANATMKIFGGAKADTVDASAITNAGAKLVFDGGGAIDTFKVGAENDVFRFDAVTDSTGTTYDTITGMNFAKDHFDLPDGAIAIKVIDAALNTGALNSAAFNANLAADVTSAHLAAHHAMLFTANSGTLSGQTFLVVDLNGTAGYQANADLVVHIVSATGTLAISDFI